MYEEIEAIEPELSDAELEANYVDHLLQIAPPIVWDGFRPDDCYCDDDCLCGPCRDAFAGYRAQRLAA